MQCMCVCVCVYICVYIHTSTYYEWFSSSIDATHHTEGMCRFANDNWRRPNAHMKILKLDGATRLALFAVSHVYVGNEITYDYGDPDAVWRQVSYMNIYFCCIVFKYKFCGDIIVHIDLWN